MKNNEKILNLNQIQEFKEKGVLVVSNIFNNEEMDEASLSFHKELLEYGIDHYNLDNTAKNINKLSSTGGAGGILDIYYSSWRLKICENYKLFFAISELWEHFYSNKDKMLNFYYTENTFPPWNEFNPKEGYIYINRVCYRIPDTILLNQHDKTIENTTFNQRKKKKLKLLQRSLTPHLDCSPYHLYKNYTKKYPRWRPIQCVTVLTDNLIPSTGGFEAVIGFHKEFNEYFYNNHYIINNNENIKKSLLHDDFIPLNMSHDKELIKRSSHISCKKGDVIFFDWRIPHANSYNHKGTIPREVIYSGFLPNIDINKEYAKIQLHYYKNNMLPIDHWQKEEKVLENLNNCNEKNNKYEYGFSNLGRKLMAIDKW